MSIGNLLYSRLTTHAGTSALISTRCYPLTLPQKPTLPALVYQQISSAPNQGTSTLHRDRYQISCWASTYSGAVALATQVQSALEEHTDTDQTPYLKMTYRVNSLDDYDPDDELYRVILDYYCEIMD